MFGRKPKPIEPPGRVTRFVPCDSIVPYSKQPRRDVIEERRILTLSRSIASNVGQINPITLRPLKSDDPRKVGPALYELVAGERRWRATMLAGKPEVWATVEEMDDARANDIAVAENTEREPITLWALLHECVARRKEKQATLDIAQLVGLPESVVNDFFTIHDNVAKDLLGKLEYDPRDEIVRRLRACARVPGNSDNERHQRQRIWWQNEGWVRKKKGQVAAPRTRVRSSTVVKLANRIELERTVRDPDTEKVVTVGRAEARRIAAAMRWVADPGNNPKPL